MADIWKPRKELQEADIQSGLKNLLYEASYSTVMAVLTGGAFMVAFALALGASNKVIGLLAAIGPLAQTAQIPAIYLVNGLRNRKIMVVSLTVLARACLLLVAAIPWFVPVPLRIPFLLVALSVYAVLSSVAGCAWNSWLRDLVPESMMGSYFAKRLAFATAFSAALSLLAGFSVDWAKSVVTDEAMIYSVLFVVGTLSGFVGVFFISRVTEPVMSEGTQGGFFQMLREPLRNQNFRRLILFLAIWNFAINLAAPFYAVYLLKRLGFSLSWVIGLAVLSQMTNVLFFRVWGRLADRFSNKSVLTVSGPLFIFSIAMWPFTTLPEKYVLTIPLLITIHILAGMSTAGVALCSGNIALKLAPYGRATAFLAVNALVSGIAATLAPILSGLASDRLSDYTLNVTLSWIAPERLLELPAVNLQGLDFMFILSFILGLYAVHRLLAVKESGEVKEQVVISELLNEFRKVSRHVSSAAGVRTLTYFPYQRLMTVIKPLRSRPDDNEDKLRRETD